MKEREAPEASRDVMVWLADAERELKKIPFFVRGKAKRNTEKFAAERGVPRSASTPFTKRRPICAVTETISPATGS
jgi:hypothetical protein